VSSIALEALREAWAGELFGEALMYALLRRLPDAAVHAGELRQIAALERSMAKVLASVPGIAVDQVAARAAAAERADAVAGSLRDWGDFLSTSALGLDAALARFGAIPEPGDRRAGEVKSLLVRHEAALIAFIALAATDCPADRNTALHAIGRDLERFLAGA